MFSFFLSNMFRPAAHADAFLHLKVQSLYKCFLKCFRFGFNDKTKHLQASAMKSPRNNQQMVSFRQVERSLWPRPQAKTPGLMPSSAVVNVNSRELPLRD